ncbi:hypothetical protein Y032_0465g1946 [Ancylostoma ceylanicum]|nr:hypothetical protein Y032_0465g1946 [Ancylostoma ceylanicum]
MTTILREIGGLIEFFACMHVKNVVDMVIDMVISTIVFCGDEPDIKKGKPHPDPFLATMNRFPVKPSDPSKVLVFEDAPNGGRAAVAAGMKCVMVPNERYRQEALKIGVTQVLHSLEEFRPEEFGLPPFD